MGAPETIPQKPTAQVFAFRVDAAIGIGIGHLMRCLTLADALADQGHSCHFLTRARSGDRQDLILERGHTLLLLPQAKPAVYGAHPNPPAHAAWLGVGWREDAAATAKILTALKPGWVILDHYALDALWEKTAIPAGVRLAVIDDLADRPHRADLLLDQNLGRQESDYAGLLPDGCQVLVGPRYALLRPEFAKKRPEAHERRKTLATKHLLITLGGVDKDNATGGILAALSNIHLPDGFHITVVMGRQAPFLEDVRQQAKAMPCPTEVCLDVKDMASLMVAADFCIGAAGSTAWERCALGLPSAMLVLAENQIEIARYLETAGCGLSLPHWNAPGFARALAKALGRFAVPESYARMVQKMFDVTSGCGSLLLSEALALERIDRES